VFARCMMVVPGVIWADTRSPHPLNEGGNILCPSPAR
jgi:hypothetical protein